MVSSAWDLSRIPRLWANIEPESGIPEPRKRNMWNTQRMEFEAGRLVKRKSVYAGRIIEVVVDRVRVAGRETIREVIRHPGGVVVLAEVSPDRIPFVRQYRYPLGQALLELPAGKIDRNEAPSASAARELEEETGFRPQNLYEVASFYSTPGFCDERLHLFYTDVVVEGTSGGEQDEQIRVEFYSLNEALRLIDKGEICDGKTMVALFWLAQRRNGTKYSLP